MHDRLAQIERNLLGIAVFLAPMRELRIANVNFIYSDLIFILVGGMLLVRRRLQIAPMQDVTIVWMVANICLIGGLFASSIVNGSATAALVVCTQYIFAYVFLPFIMIRDEQTALLLLKAAVFGCLFVVVSGFIFAATGYDNGFKYITGSGRLASFAGNPNDFAMMIALNTPLLMYLWFARALPGTLCLAIITCFFVALIMASSNSGIGATAVGMAAFLLFAGNIRLMVKGAMVAGLLVLAASTIGYDYLPEVFQQRVLAAFESGDIESAGTFKGRMHLIVEALDQLDGTLLLGFGADQYRERSYWHEPVHNQYLLVWVEGGTIALVGWLLILVSMAFIGIRSYQHHGGSQAAALALATTIVISIIGTTSPHLYSRFWMVPLLVAIGLPLTRQATVATAPASPSTPGKPPQRTPGHHPTSLPHRPAMQAQIRYRRRR